MSTRARRCWQELERKLRIAQSRSILQTLHLGLVPKTHPTVSLRQKPGARIPRRLAPSFHEFGIHICDSPWIIPQRIMIGKIGAGLAECQRRLKIPQPPVRWCWYVPPCGSPSVLPSQTTHRPRSTYRISSGTPPHSRKAPSCMRSSVPSFWSRAACAHIRRL